MKQYFEYARRKTFYGVSSATGICRYYALSVFWTTDKHYPHLTRSEVVTDELVYDLEIDEGILGVKKRGIGKRKAQQTGTQLEEGAGRLLS